MSAELAAGREGSLGRWALGVGGWLVYTFLYLPLVVVIVYSFNGNQVASWPITHWSTGAYSTLINDADLTGALRNSLYVSSIAVTLAVILGTAAALGFYRLRIPGKEVFSFAVTLPIVLPGIVTGIAILTFLTDINYNLSLNTIVVGHVTFCVVLVFNNVRARLVRVPPQLAEAARDLGAGPWRTFWYVTLPSIRTAVLSGALLAFTLSFDEVVVSFFLAGRENTLPLEIWSRLRRETISPELNAVATVLIAISTVLVLASQLVVREE